MPQNSFFTRTSMIKLIQTVACSLLCVPCKGTHVACISHYAGATTVCSVAFVLMMFHLLYVISYTLILVMLGGCKI